MSGDRQADRLRRSHTSIHHLSIHPDTALPHAYCDAAALVVFPRQCQQDGTRRPEKLSEGGGGQEFMDGRTSATGPPLMPSWTAFWIMLHARELEMGGHGIREGNLLPSKRPSKGMARFRFSGALFPLSCLASRNYVVVWPGASTLPCTV